MDAEGYTAPHEVGKLKGDPKAVAARATTKATVMMSRAKARVSTRSTPPRRHTYTETGPRQGQVWEAGPGQLCGGGASGGPSVPQQQLVGSGDAEGHPHHLRAAWGGGAASVNSGGLNLCRVEKTLRFVEDLRNERKDSTNRKIDHEQNNTPTTGVTSHRHDITF